jgi:endonuclease/exonuclease/phosphatase family metal-dependent hydrolase
VIVTHLHHIVADSLTRLAQLPVILDLWDSQAQTIQLGDLNSETGFEKIRLLSREGLIDSWAKSRSGDGFMYYAAEPPKRIDFLWHSPDLKVEDIAGAQTPASDHLSLLGEFLKNSYLSLLEVRILI